ncbi:hypothetical protein LMG28727_03881 [Paraburkholderia kirstenboschensis]|uniref:hypothetical protein n=1 Tax=Paraburkholderia kirstenboschensis TaxID=1245436 RepID=UPI000FFC2097|nr:hypothetical protein [Paraburkholderia kirstenboschensis]CAD6541589.1 hypothetical protein LMG28727_03881 [Paraburkholderia kirstenboschensis]
MQIDSALPSTLEATDRATRNASSTSFTGGDAATARSATSNASEQDEAVHISTEGAATAALDRNAVGATSAADAGSDGRSAVDSSAVKSFAYGTLGLERPDQPHEERNAFYTAGRWLAAGITLGGIVSLLI